MSHRRFGVRAVRANRKDIWLGVKDASCEADACAYTRAELEAASVNMQGRHLVAELLGTVCVEQERRTKNVHPSDVMRVHMKF